MNLNIIGFARFLKISAYVNNPLFRLEAKALMSHPWLK
jgi:hypothetical protein